MFLSPQTGSWPGAPVESYHQLCWVQGPVLTGGVHGSDQQQPARSDRKSSIKEHENMWQNIPKTVSFIVIVHFLIPGLVCLLWNSKGSPGSSGGAVLHSEMQIRQLTDSDYKSNRTFEVHWLKLEINQHLNCSGSQLKWMLVMQETMYYFYCNNWIYIFFHLKIFITQLLIYCSFTASCILMDDKVVFFCCCPSSPSQKRVRVRGFTVHAAILLCRSFYFLLGL